MNIIVLREGDAGARPRSLTLTHLGSAFVLLFILVPLIVGGGAFWLQQAWRPVSARQAAVARLARRVAQARALSRRDLTVLARRVGGLRARMSRLDALAERLTVLAGIPADVFRFQHVPPLGGEQVSAHRQWTPYALEALSARLKARLAFKALQLRALAGVVAAHKVTLITTPRGWPVRGGWISSPFGRRPDPFTGRPGFHPGVDIAAPVGTPVHALAAGVVIFAGLDGGFGRLVKIFDGHHEITMYAHLSARYVHVGEIVRKGQLLGRVGDTGYSTGPHLHFEVLSHDAPINPIGFLDLADRR